MQTTQTTESTQPHQETLDYLHGYLQSITPDDKIFVNKYIKDLINQVYSKNISSCRKSSSNKWLIIFKKGFKNPVWPTDDNDEKVIFTREFIKGFYEGYNCRFLKHTASICLVHDYSEFLELLQDSVGIDGVMTTTFDNQYLLKFIGSKALDFFGFIYPTPCEYDTLKSRVFKSLFDAKVQYTKTRPNAIAPFKYKTSDSGIILTCNKQSICNLYDTGIAIDCPYGYYFEIMPLDDVVSAIIDMNYKGTIMVTRRNDDAVFKPFNVVLIPRKFVNIELLEKI